MKPQPEQKYSKDDGDDINSNSYIEVNVEIENVFDTHDWLDMQPVEFIGEPLVEVCHE